MTFDLASAAQDGDTRAPYLERFIHGAELKRALAAPDVAERFAAAGLVPAGSSPEVMAATVKQNVARFAVLVKSIGIKPE
jgi:tripartite-type tricarboxylate transporter receptor subunit TctC